MYGIINKAIKEFVVIHYGEKNWKAMQLKECCPPGFLSTEQPYNEILILECAKCISEIKNENSSSVLERLGQFVICATHKNYTTFMDSRGDNLKDYLINLPEFHNRISLIYPELKAPEFSISTITPNSLQLHYNCLSEDFSPFIKGYIKGITIIFNESVATIPVPNTSTRLQSIFNIKW